MKTRSDTLMIGVRVTPEQAAAVDDLRRSEPDVPTRVEMLRRLVERAIAKRGASK